MSDCYESRLSIENTAMLAAHLIADCRSKDPSTKVGCVVYDPDTGSMHLGYNGFLPGVPDLKTTWNNRNEKDPESKYSFVEF